ncbi:hypothetical protein VCSRO66_3464 [Vibrio cholerae]|uniref:hypothetical protein n=1 Tax=Vibrio cholerae TaxID=666 RepID=UPI001E3D08BE|nr:hypothetical protein [Vibrio cholerae]MCD6644667.1 hypothetical protein [Vibrio cholerae]MDA5314871.1 hypothetical protein [Vibrio cholerae]MDT3744967.1 hypothetical protein [Vibrio cholerae]GHX82981.1 hypothetical protein VCSRO66_3464 [Vibrio cholerae]
MQFSDLIAGVALLVSLVTLYRSSYYYCFIFNARLVEVNRNYKETDGDIVKDELNCNFIMSNTGNSSIFIDKLIVESGVNKEISSIDNLYDIKVLLLPGETTSHIVDLKAVKFLEGHSYTFTFLIYDSSVSRFHVRDVVDVLKSNSNFSNLTLNRYCRFNFKFTSFSLIKRWKVWRYNVKYN